MGCEVLLFHWNPHRGIMLCKSEKEENLPKVHFYIDYKSIDWKEQWNSTRLTQTCSWVSRSLQQRRGLAGAYCRFGGAECSSECMGFFEGGCHYPHYLHDSLASGQIIGREHCPTHQQKNWLKTYWTWPHPSEQDPVSPSVSLSHQEASISLLSFSIRGQIEWKPQPQQTNQSDDMDHSFV